MITAITLHALALAVLANLLLYRLMKEKYRDKGVRAKEHGWIEQSRRVFSRLDCWRSMTYTSATTAVILEALYLWGGK